MTLMFNKLLVYLMGPRISFDEFHLSRLSMKFSYKNQYLYLWWQDLMNVMNDLVLNENKI